MTPEQLRRKALALGAEVQIGGERFNTARQQMKTRMPPPKRAAPAAPLPDYITRQEVKTMLDDLNEAWEQRMDILLATMQKPSPPPAPPPEWDFKVDYMRGGAIEAIRAIPRKT